MSPNIIQRTQRREEGLLWEAPCHRAVQRHVRLQARSDAWPSTCLFLTQAELELGGCGKKVGGEIINREGWCYTAT